MENERKKLNLSFYAGAEGCSQAEEYIKNHPKGHFCQSELWGRVKSDWERAMIVARDDEGNIRGTISFVMKKTPLLPYRLIYAPRGPVCDTGDADAVTALMEGTKQLAKRKKGYIIMLDPDVPAADRRFCELLEASGFERSKSDNFDGGQPNFVFRLDIKNRTKEEIFENFSSKTKYNIRLAGRKGVVVRVGADNGHDLEEFVRLMKITGERDGFSTRSIVYFRRLLSGLGGCARLYVAELDGKIIAGTIAIQYGNKTWYLYGVSDNESRNVMPNHLLQWEMIGWAVDSGSEIFDFRGVSGDLSPENPLYGLYRFKKGFGGEFTEFCGEFSLVTRPFVRRCVDAAIRLKKKIR